VSWDSEDEKAERDQNYYMLRDATVRLLVNANVDQRNRLTGFLHALELILEDVRVPTERVATAFALDVRDDLRMTWVQKQARGTANETAGSLTGPPEANKK
jgi:hypothetical protein